jgi:hypothetical protein
MRKPPPWNPRAWGITIALLVLGIAALRWMFAVGWLTGMPFLPLPILAGTIWAHGWLEPRASWNRHSQALEALAAFLCILPLVLYLSGPTCAIYIKESSAHSASMRNLQKIGLGMLSYHDSHKRFPPAWTKDAAGKPLLSWRVLMLPYLEEHELYNKFKLNEPWDSPHNLQLLPLMPSVYATPSGMRIPGKAEETYYQVFVGPGTVFEEKAKGVNMNDIIRLGGTSRTILVIEAGTPVPWTKPADLVYDPAAPLPPVGGMFNREREWYDFLETRRFTLHVVFADGSVHDFRPPPEEEKLRQGVVPNDGKWMSDR